MAARTPRSPRPAMAAAACAAPPWSVPEDAAPDHLRSHVLWPPREWTQTPLHRRKVCSMTECLNTAQNTSISYLSLLQKFMTDLASSNNIYLSSPSFGGKKYRGLDWLHCGGLTSCSLPALWSETPGRTNVKCAWAGAALGCLGPQS